MKKAIKSPVPPLEERIHDERYPPHCAFRLDGTVSMRSQGLLGPVSAEVAGTSGFKASVELTARLGANEPWESVLRC